jgi:hypothetical protein
VARLFALLLALLFLLPATARADGDPVLRFDLMSGALIASAQSARVSAESLSPALTLDLGAQITDHAAIFARLEGGTIALAASGAAYLITEWTPHPVISLGTGVGYDGISDASVLLCAGGTSCLRSTWSGVSVPLIVGFNLQSRNAVSAAAPNHHGRLRIELEAAGGYAEKTQTWGIHAFVGIGATWM